MAYYDPDNIEEPDLYDEPDLPDEQEDLWTQPDRAEVLNRAIAEEKAYRQQLTLIRKLLDDHEHDPLPEWRVRGYQQHHVAHEAILLRVYGDVQRALERLTRASQKREREYQLEDLAAMHAAEYGLMDDSGESLPF